NPLDSLTEDQYTSVNPYGRFSARKDVERSGHMGETVVSVGGAYQDRLYIGASLGFPSINFREKSTYSEFDLESEHELSDFSYTEELRTSGRGVNFKIGAIYKITEHLRVGAAWHSPSYLSLTDSYDTEINANYKDGDQLSSVSPDGSFTYSIRTPARYLANAAFVLGKSGLISADYEYVNYDNAKLNSANGPGEEYDFAAENSAVKSIYRATHNVRAGFEWRVLKPISLRCGFSYQQTAFDPALTDANTNRLTYSFGAGFRKKGGYLDIAYQRAAWEGEYYHFDPSIVAGSNIQHIQGQAVVSIGFRY
ncbi:MAG: OmpP1/FadL family transporter, partial [Flavobacteriales bacterium]